MKNTPENFCYWLQGYFEISGAKKLSKEETKIVKEKLNSIFEKKTPNRSKKIPIIPIEESAWGSGEGISSSNSNIYNQLDFSKPHTTC